MIHKSHHELVIQESRFKAHNIYSHHELGIQESHTCESSFEILVVANLQVVSQMKSNIFHIYEKCALNLWTHKEFVDSWFPRLSLNPSGITIVRKRCFDESDGHDYVKT